MSAAGEGFARHDDLLEPVAARLGIRLGHLKTLPVTEEAQKTMFEMMWR